MRCAHRVSHYQAAGCYCSAYASAAGGGLEVPVALSDMIVAMSDITYRPPFSTQSFPGFTRSNKSAGSSVSHVCPATE
jgi:hypothetical protein